MRKCLKINYLFVKFALFYLFFVYFLSEKKQVELSYIYLYYTDNQPFILVVITSLYIVWGTGSSRLATGIVLREKTNGRYKK